MQIMKTAQETCAQLQRMDECDHRRLEELSQEYLQLVVVISISLVREYQEKSNLCEQRVYVTMLEHVHLVQPYSQYHRSNYNVQQQIEVLEGAKDMLSNEDNLTR